MRETLLKITRVRAHVLQDLNEIRAILMQDNKLLLYILN